MNEPAARARLWDDEDGFFYDVLHSRTDGTFPLKVRSMVGLIPLFAVETLDPEIMSKLPGFTRGSSGSSSIGPDLTAHVAEHATPAGRASAACWRSSTRDAAARVLKVMLDEREFLSPYGIRSLSRVHAEHPYTLQFAGEDYRVDYEPAESTTGLFGGNSNWRGPGLVSGQLPDHRGAAEVPSLLRRRLHRGVPDRLGRMMTLCEVAAELSRRLTRIFLRGEDGRRPVYGGTETFQDRSALARPDPLPRVLPRRHRRRPRRQPSDRLDRARREAAAAEHELLGDLGFDSLQVLELVGELEDHFKGRRAAERPDPHSHRRAGDRRNPRARARAGAPGVIGAGTVAEALVAAAAFDRGIRAIEHDGRSLLLPYTTLLAESLQIAGALHARGLTPGHRVALVIPEVSDFIRAFFGISAAGLVPVPLCPPPRRATCRPSRANRGTFSSPAAPAPSSPPPASRRCSTSAASIARSLVSVDELRSGPALARPEAVPADRPALLQFTSGSTAAPKGVVLTHANLHANITAITGPDGLGTRPTDIGVSWLPLYHDMGLIGMLLSAVYSGADAIVMSPVLFLKRPTAWLEAISTYRGTVSFAPNFAYEVCLRRVKPSQIDALDLSSWRLAGCGAEPIRPDTLHAFAERFARAGFRASSFVASYGLAEHSLAVALAPDGVKVDSVDAQRLVRQSIAVPPVEGSTQVVRLVGCGSAFPDHELRIVDDEGRPLPERHVGSIIARGPSVMQGYFEDPAATAEALRDGWLHTGDLGYMADGQLFVCGRTKDLIIRQGRKYHPPDLESAIGDLPGIRPPASSCSASATWTRPTKWSRCSKRAPA